jgi:hypothetical protein
VLCGFKPRPPHALQIQALAPATSEQRYEHMLEIAEKNWNVVVNGSWNPGILTPIGIGRQLFGMPEGMELAVSVPLNVVAPPKVMHENLTVIVTTSLLIVEVGKSSYAELIRAMEIGRKALDALPLTPVRAAGYNVFLKAPADYEPFAKLFSAKWDSSLADAKYEVTQHVAGRTVRWGDGEINLKISQDAGKDFEADLNFHRGSEKIPDLHRWLSASDAEVKTEADRLIATLSEGKQ